MSGKAQNPKNEVLSRTATLAKEAGKGVVKEFGEISKGVLSELVKIATLQKK
jgi:hypothetical protein